MVALTIGVSVAVLILIIPSEILSKVSIFCIFALVGGLVAYFLFSLVGIHTLNEEGLALLAAVPAVLIGHMATQHFASEPPRRTRPLR